MFFKYFNCTGEISPQEMSVVFEPGVMNNESKCINISIIDDNDFEGDDIYTVEISSIYPPIAFGTGDTIDITIQDNNGNLY